MKFLVTLGQQSVSCLYNSEFPFRQRPAAGACVAALTGAFPVCFLEPALNQNNPYSIYNTMSATEREGNKHTNAQLSRHCSFQPYFVLLFFWSP